MRKASAHGTPDQMIAAVQKQIDMLSGSPSSVQSTTSVKGASAYGGPYGVTKGTSDQMIAAVEKKVSQLGGKSTEVISSSDRDVTVTDYDTEDCYIDTDGCFGDCGDTISMKDIKNYWNSNSTYDPCLAQYDDFQGWWADTRKWLKQVNCSDNLGVEDIEDEYIAASAEEGVVSLEDESAVKKYLHFLTGEVIKGLNEAGITEHIVEAGEGDTAVCVIIPDNGFATELAVPCDDLKWDWGKMSEDVAYIVNAVKEHLGSDEFTEIASKQIRDWDGFMTDYTMYKHEGTNEYVFVYGDKDRYTPEGEDFDAVVESEEEAWEWFNSYTGFSDEDEDDDIYLATAVTASYSPDMLDELVNYYSQFELSSEEIWDQIVAQYEDEDLADDVLEALGR